MLSVQLLCERTELQLRMELDHVVLDKEAHEVARVGQKQLFDILVLRLRLLTANI